MKTPRDLTGEEAIKVLIKHFGWELHKRKGSHVTLKHKSVREILTIPLHDSLKPGTLTSILHKANIDKEMFLEKL